MKKVLFVLTLSALFTACTSVETQEVKQDSIIIDSLKSVKSDTTCVEEIDTTTAKKK
jgi:hypothetical protein